MSQGTTVLSKVLQTLGVLSGTVGGFAAVGYIASFPLSPVGVFLVALLCSLVSGIAAGLLVYVLLTRTTGVVAKRAS